MRILPALLVASVIALWAAAQNPPAELYNWGKTREGVRVSLSLDKLTYSLGEGIPLHIAAEVVSATHPAFGAPDALEGAFRKGETFSRSFHLTVTDQHGAVVGNSDRSNLYLIWSGSSGPDVCPEPLEVGRVYPLEQTASRRQALLPMKPGIYHFSVTWSPYPAADPPCSKSGRAVDPKELQPFVTVSSPSFTIKIIPND